MSSSRVSAGQSVVKSCLRLIIALSLFSGPAVAQSVMDEMDMAGVYQKPGMSCTSAAPGEPNGPALIEQDSFRVGGMECAFTSRTSVARMQALLIDATCQIGRTPRATRIFINKSASGLTLVSRELGTFVLEPCM